MSVAEPLLQFEGVHKTYDAVEVLRGVDLAVAPHEVVCLIGASGCGKSTLLKCANLIEPVSEGRIVFRRPGDHGARRQHRQDPPRHRDRVPGIQPVPAHARARWRCSRN